ncbi:MAG: sulfatase [Verrucomicrobiota bacterium]
MKHLILLLICALTYPAIAWAERPNILWIVVDDMSANFSCYGESLIETPAVDQLASEGLKFTRAYATAPVCSTFRSALITGMYQNSIGAHHHRSGRGENRVQLPDGVEPIPAHFQRAGYWTCIGSGLPGIDSRGLPTSMDRKGKTDYNFDWEEAIYDSHDWADRAQDQPFFMQVQLPGGKLRGDSVEKNNALSDRAKNELGDTVDPADVVLPPYYPRDELLLRDWSTYLDSVRLTDLHVKKVIERLREEDLLDSTLIVFFTDHGISHARGKQFLYDEGTHIPLVLCGPGISEGVTRTDLVEHIDIAALSLAAAGIEIPESMQGRDLLAENYKPREAIFAARDRCGEAVDQIRSVRTDDYLYIRNYFPNRPHLQPSNYKDSKAILQRLRELHEQGTTDSLTESLLFAPDRPEEELYNYQADPWQLKNLAADPKHQKTLESLRQKLKVWTETVGDPGPETPEIYDLEIQSQLTTMKPGSVNYEAYKRNSELYKQWHSEGK